MVLAGTATRAFALQEEFLGGGGHCGDHPADESRRRLSGARASQITRHSQGVDRPLTDCTAAFGRRIDALPAAAAGRPGGGPRGPLPTGAISG